jgi:dolichyl-phosphate-mannose--protein O-mannosyl transferase
MGSPPRFAFLQRLGTTSRTTLMLLVLGLVTRFWSLGTPDTAVFDEVPYQEYVSHYFSGVSYFNLHPPAGKLILALGAKVLGVEYAVLAGGELSVALRTVAALFGALVVPLFFILLIQLGASRRVAMLGALLLLVDNALISVSRLVLLDSLHLFCILGALSAYLASLTREGRGRLGFLLTAGVLAGVAVGTKWSGLAAMGMIGAHVAWRAYDSRRLSREMIRDAGIIAAMGIAVYVGAFAIHFALLPMPNPGTSPLDPDRNASIARKIVLVHKAMVVSNASYETFQHSGASPWWSWPILKHPIYFWKGAEDAAGRAGHMMIEGNPVVWWGALAGIAAIVVGLISGAGRRRLQAHRGLLAFLAACWLINYLPYAFISRVLFIYTYVPALAFSIALAVVGVGTLVGWMDDERRGARLYWAFAGLAVVSFLYFAPISYGTPITESGFRQRMNLLERN